VDYAEKTKTTQEDIYLTTSYRYDKKGNMTKVYPPNYHNPPSTSANRNDYVTTYTYDHFGRVKTSDTPDGGLTRNIYDSKTGRLRFVQTANAAQEQKILYFKYDHLGRPVEEGYHSFNWNQNTLQNYADNDRNWPSNVTTWRKRYTYGSHGLSAASYGALVEVQINSDTNIDVEIKEKLTVDAVGRIIKKQTELIDQGLNYSFLYKYDNAGNIIQEQYGTMNIIYTYDDMGRLSFVGKPNDLDYYASYTYDFNGVLTSEVINYNSWARNFTYDQSKRLTKIEDPFFKQTLSYEGGYFNKTFYDGWIANTSIDYKTITTLGNTKDDYSIHYDYDVLGRMITAGTSNNPGWEIGTNWPTTYDSNGNITKVQRTNQSKVYTYTSGTNKAIVFNNNGRGLYRF
nr:hypothetical protein [Saprospiraceae bacterium]